MHRSRTKLLPTTHLLIVLACSILIAGPRALTANERSTPYRVALSELQSLEARDAATSSGQLSRVDLLARNLSRYFTIYPVPDEAQELQRVLGTLQRIVRDAGRLFVGASVSVAQSAGAAEVQTAHVGRVAQGLLPFQPTPDGDRVYFAQRWDEDGANATLIERWDLQALLDTGMVWEVLGGLAEGIIEPSIADGSGLPWSDDATRLLADVLNAYGLLTLRLGGQVARAGFEEAVATRHLREAVKVLRNRADGQEAPLENPYRPQRTAQTLPQRLFVDATESSGLDFRHRSSDWIGRFRRFGPVAPTFSGGGVAVADVNGDAWPDVVICGGRGCGLFVNQQGRFVDRSEASGVVLDGEARMPILADLDNDGDQDLFVTYARDPNRLWINDGTGRFTLRAGTGLETQGDISGPAAAVDVDNDGLLDLYVGNFGNYLAGSSAWAAQEAVNGMANRLYRNLGPGANGELRFEEISERSGVGDTGWAQALSHLDVDRDGDQDLYIANDFGRNQLFLNRGDGVFDAAGARTESDDRFHGMNVSFADLNNDGYGDIFITNIWLWAATSREATETNTLLLSSKPASADLTYQRSEHPSLLDQDSGWAWAALFFDVDNDADDDLFVANGFTDYMTFAQYRPRPGEPDTLFAINNGREPNLFFLGDGASVPGQLVGNSGLEMPELNARSAARIDFDRDGDLDLVVTTFHHQVRLFENRAATATNGQLRVELKGDASAGVNRDAIGAQLRLTLEDGSTIWRAVTGGEGYLGMSERTVHFGLGASRPQSLEILWPGGRLETLTELPTGSALRITYRRDEPSEVVTRNVDAEGP